MPAEGPARRLATSGRRLLVAAVTAGLTVALTGCDPGGANSLTKAVNPGDDTGAVLVVKPTAVTVPAGQPAGVVLDVTGSKFASEPTTCPTSVAYFLDDRNGADGTSGLSSMDTGGSCQVVDGTIDVQLEPGTPGTSRAQKVGVHIEGNGNKGIVATSAETTVTVTTLAEGQTVPASTPPPQPTGGTPTSGGTTTAPPPPVKVQCGPDPVEPSGFTWGFTVNPYPAVVGQAVAFDGTTTADTAGTVTQYAWDTDGDGTADVTSTDGRMQFTPAAAGTLNTCIAATDSAGRTATHPWPIDVKPAGTYTARAFTVSPSAPAPGQDVTVTPDKPAGTSKACVNWGDGSVQTCEPDALTHQYDTAGTYYVGVDYTSTAGEFANWTTAVRVGAARSARAFRAAAGADPAAVAAKRKAASKKHKSKALKLSVPLSTKAKLVTRGKTTYKAGKLSTKGGIAAGRMTAKLSKKAKKKVPAALRFLVASDFVFAFDGDRVLVTPTLSGLAGTGKILARSAKDRKTYVCIRVKTDGLTKAGTKWTILGATRRAGGYVGGGTSAPPLFGDDGGIDISRSASLTLRKGKRHGIGACRSLAKYLPKATKTSKKSKKGHGRR